LRIFLGIHQGHRRIGEEKEFTNLILQNFAKIFMEIIHFHVVIISGWKVANGMNFQKRYPTIVFWMVR
jgi:hypothetical protein